MVISWNKKDVYITIFVFIDFLIKKKTKYSTLHNILIYKLADPCPLIKNYSSD